MTCIIAISNQKGGVAKTTTCFSLGACLAERGQRVLMVDLDSQANLTIANGLDPDELEWSIVDLFQGEVNLGCRQTETLFYPTAMPGLELLPADLRLASLERFLYEQEDYETYLQDLLVPWKERYQYILFDCPPALGAMTIVALTAADMVIIPTQCEYYAAQGLMHLLDIAHAVQQRTNPSLHCFLLVTFYDPRNRMNRRVFNQLQVHFKDHLLKTVINLDARLREAPAVGEPINIYSPKTRASQQYRQLAEEIDSLVKEVKT
jgi:chromosome partitioning protein